VFSFYGLSYILYLISYIVYIVYHAVYTSQAEAARSEQYGEDIYSTACVELKRRGAQITPLVAKQCVAAAVQTLSGGGGGRGHGAGVYMTYDI
jgi:hypothetical protein